jgi:DNA polymerase III delta prime subunit
MKETGSRIIGNASVVEALVRLADRPNLGHAYLLSGPAGVGKKLAALAFARAVNCTCDGADVCCESCQLMDSLNHPELLLLEDANKPRWFRREHITELLEAEGANGEAPYGDLVSHLVEEGYLEEPLPLAADDVEIDGFNIVTDLLFGRGSVPSKECYTPKPASDAIRKQLDSEVVSAREYSLLKMLYEYPLSIMPYRGAIPIAYVTPRQGWKFTRPIQAFLSMRTMSGGKKIVIIDDAHKMTPEAQNCLLKTLEEPPPDSILILVTSRKEILFETIVSRCQVVSFKRLTRPEIDEARRRMLGAGYEHGDLVVSLSENCPGRLLELSLTDVADLMDRVRDFFESVSGGHSGGAFRFARRVLDEGGSHRRKARGAARQAIELLIFWIIEVIRAGQGQPAAIAAPKLADALKAHSGVFDEARLLDASAHLEGALRLVNLNVDMALLLHATLLRTARILTG